MIGNFTGESEFLVHKECLAGNPHVHGQLVPILHKYSKFALAGEKAAVRQDPTHAPSADDASTASGRDE